MHHHRATAHRAATTLVLANALAFAGLAVAGPAPSESDAALPEGRTLVFASDEWCPYVCFESTREGYLVDLARALFETTARPVEIRRMSWARALREAEAGRIDGVLGASSRESSLLVYPRHAAAGDPVAFAVRREDPWRFFGTEALANRRIGVADGYRFGPPFDDALFPGDRPAGNVEAVDTDNPTLTNLQKLVGGRIDTLVENRHVLGHEVERGGFRHAVRLVEAGTQQPLFFAFPDTAEGRALARHMDARMQDDRAKTTLAALADEYGPMGATP